MKSKRRSTVTFILVMVVLGFLTVPGLKAQNNHNQNSNYYVASIASGSHSKNANAVSNKLNNPVRIKKGIYQLGELINLIASQVDLKPSYSKAFVPVDKKIRVPELETSAKEALSRVLKGTLMGFKVLEGKQLVFVKKLIPSLQVVQETVSGTVTNAQTGEPISDVNIIVRGTDMGTATDADGQYSLQVPSLQDTLVFSFIGYESEVVPVRGRTVINVQLQPTAIMAEEIVVTALGIENTKRQLGYSVQSIDGSELQTVKSVDIGTSLTGKIAGLKVLNSTEFFADPSIQLRGQTPLLVIDGIPYGNMSLRDLNPDDIKSIDVLKGATASALYGARGGDGVIMVTTKKGGLKEDLSVSVNSSTMFFAGFLALPKHQDEYSSGFGGEYNTVDYVWGAKLDVGNIARQWDPIAKEYKKMELKSRGTNNFENFLQTSFVTNNSVAVTKNWEDGSIRTSFNHIYKKGQYPNSKLQMFNYALSGKMNIGDKFSFTGRVSYSKHKSPQIIDQGYGSQGYIYQILVWTGPEYNLMKYRDYWLVEDIKQNWNRDSWYDNPWLVAYEKIHSIDNNTFTASLNANYELFEGVELRLRTGLDYYFNKEMKRNPPNINSLRGWAANGMYQTERYNGFSINNDLILSFVKEFGDFSIDGLLGGTIYYYEDEYLGAGTKGGITIPGFYSLNNSVEPPSVSTYEYRKQVNSLYGKVSIGYQNKIYLHLTGRNDWSSTLPESTRSFFYPSVGLSMILSDIISLPNWISYWKLRGSWTISKNDLGVYDLNRVFSVVNGVWNDLNSADAPNTLRGSNIKPQTERTYEVGTNISFIQDRLSLGFTYYNKYIYNVQTYANISRATGYSSRLINTDETYVRRGFEVAIDATPIMNNNFRWNVNLNWSTTTKYYHSLDPVYSPDQYWVRVGARVDAIADNDWKRSPNGRIIYQNGLPVASEYASLIGYSKPDWMWGLTNNFKYKNFSLSISIDGRVGGVFWNNTAAALWESGAHPASVTQWRYDEVVNDKLTFVGDGVVVVSGGVKRDKYGRIIKDTREFAPNTEKESYESFIRSYWESGTQIYDKATFFKIREIALGYSLPSSFTSKLGAKQISVSLIAQNVYLWTSDLEYGFVDPDVGYNDLNSPSIRYIGFNIDLTF